MADSTSGLQLRSLIKTNGELEISLQNVPTPEPGPDEVVVRVEATPINPSDIGLLIGPADMALRLRKLRTLTRCQSNVGALVKTPARLS